jgi:hypothetical protein
MGDAARRDPVPLRGSYPLLGRRSLAQRVTGMKGAPTSCSTRSAPPERGLAYGARALGRRSPRRRRRWGKPTTGRRGTGELTTHEGRAARGGTPTPSWASSESGADAGSRGKPSIDHSTTRTAISRRMGGSPGMPGRCPLAPPRKGLIPWRWRKALRALPPCVMSALEGPPCGASLSKRSLRRRSAQWGCPRGRTNYGQKAFASC